MFSHTRWFGFGLLPALLTLVLYAAAFTTLGFFTGDLAAWAESLARGWGLPLETAFGVLFAVLLWAAALALAVVAFAAITLLIGDPFYEKLSEEVEKAEGHCPEGPDLPLWRELWNAVRDSLFVLSRMLLFTVPLFLLGFVPVIGQSVIPALGFCVAGFFLTLELSSVALQRRGIPVRERLRMLRARKGLGIGFGLPLVVFPPLMVLLMPGAVAGAALLARDLVGAGEERDAGAGDERQPAQGEFRTPGGSPPWTARNP